MARRTSKKNKKLTLTDVRDPTVLAEFYGRRNELWMRRMRRLASNALVGNLNLPRLRPETRTVIERVEEFNSNAIYISDTETGELCVICNFHLTKKFPEDFPDEFKFCCQCKAFAHHIISDGVNKLINLYIVCGMPKFSGQIEKIHKRITMVG